MMSDRTPPAEHEIDEALARSLLRSQHPDLADLSLRALGQGWDNAMFRLGDSMTLRLPRREASAGLLRAEQRWLGSLAPRLPLPVPEPLRIGEPALGYPWHWSVLPWLPGEPADLAPPRASEATELAAFLRALHRPAPADAPTNAVRGVPLSQRAAAVEERLTRLRTRTDAISPAVEATWQDALAAAPATDPCWLHGDLHSRNVLVDNGRLSAIIDWGDITSGDVATDLASIWMLFDEPSTRANALTCYATDPGTSRRARGWAVLFGAVLLDTGLVDEPRHARMGEQTLRRIAEDHPPGPEVH